MNLDVLNPGMPFFAIGLDVGGTKIAAGVVRFPDGRVIARQQVPTPLHLGSEAVLDACHQLAADLATAARAHGRTIHAVGIGLCELVDPSGRPRSSATLAWETLPVRERFGSIAPTVLEADVRAAALAEAEFGAGRQRHIFLYVTVGTGISSSLVVGRRPFAGVRGAAGTFASSPLPACATAPQPPPTLEQCASGLGLVNRFRAAGGTADSAVDVLAAAAAGDPRAVDIVTSGASTLGAGIGWLVNVLDPEAVVLGGSLGLAQGLFRERLVEGMRRQIWWDGHRDLPVVDAVTGNDAGLLGAATTAWYRVGQAHAAYRI
ncbi:MAG: ROK family protein [Verrucomicrobiales bacterium]|nr:ROK family protein [Verrucomicrobiales bacterium]